MNSIRLCQATVCGEAAGLATGATRGVAGSGGSGRIPDSDRRRLADPWDLGARAGRGVSSGLEEPRQRLRHLAGRLESAFGLLGEHLGNERGQLGRNLGTDEVQRVGVHREVGLVEVPEIRATEGGVAGQEVVKGAAEAVDISTDIRLLGVADLLGGDVIGSAEHLAFAGQAGIDLAFARDLGEAEIEHLDDRLFSLASQDQVGRLDVAVNHPALMRMLKPQRRLIDEIAGIRHRQRTARFHQLREVFPLDILHRQDDALAEPRGRVSGDDVLVLQLRGRLDLAEEAVEHAGAIDKVTADHLEYFHPLQQQVLGQVNHSHAASPQLADDLEIGVVGQPRRQRIGRWRGADGHLAGDRARSVRIAEPSQEAVARHPGDPSLAFRADFQVLDHRFGRAVVQLPEPEIAQRLIGWMEGSSGAHGRFPWQSDGRRLIKKGPKRGATCLGGRRLSQKLAGLLA